jgi:hypothetical protein
VYARGVRLLVSLAIWLGGCAASGHTDAPEVAPSGAGEAEVAVEVARAEPAGAGPRVYDAAEVVCERAVRCGTIGRSQLEECRKGPDASRLTLVWGYDEKLGIPGLVAAGRLREVPGSEQTCLAFLATAACVVDPATAPKGCQGGSARRVLNPGVTPGGKCTRSDECVDGFCTAQAGCEGVCVATAGPGGACGADTLCGEGEFCEAEKCRPRAGAGAECGGHWQWCQDGLECDGWEPEVDSEHRFQREKLGRCSAGRRLGEGCVRAHDGDEIKCAAGLFCDWGMARPECRAPLKEGDECGWLAGCADGLTCAGLELGGFHPAGRRFATKRAGRCARHLDPGDACDPTAFVSGCPGSMRCDPAARVCRSRGHAGDPCTSSWISTPQPSDRPIVNNGCFSGLYCEVATRTCQPQQAKGTRCTPQKFGVEDQPCFLGRCDERSRRCIVKCE